MSDTRPLDDSVDALVRRAQAGEEAARDDLIRRCYDRIHHWALMRTADRDDADDVTQTVLVRLYTHRDRYSGRSRFTTWLFRVTQNAANALHRRSGARRRLADRLEREHVNIIRPYVFSDRPDAPGQMSFVDDAVTVRETPDNLDKIARVLAEFDRPTLSVRLHFQIIQADGAARSDPAIAEVEAALRKLFRFRGYRLVGEAVVGGTEHSEASQEIAGEGGPYAIIARIHEVRGSADSGIIRLERP